MTASRQAQPTGWTYRLSQLDDQTTCRSESPTPGPLGGQKSDHEMQLRQVLSRIILAIDSVAELRGAGIILQLPARSPLPLRKSEHPSELPTYVVIKVTASVPEFQRTEWDRWSDVATSCGNVGIMALGTKAACAAAVGTAGVAGVVCVLGFAGTVASVMECGLAVGKATSPEFDEYIQSDDGKLIRYTELALKLFQLGVTVATLSSALRSALIAKDLGLGGRLLQSVRKGKLAKELERIEIQRKNLKNLRAFLETGLRTTNPAGKKELTNNIIKRMLPFVWQEVRRERIAFLAWRLSAPLSVWAVGRLAVTAPVQRSNYPVEIVVFQIVDLETEP